MDGFLLLSLVSLGIAILFWLVYTHPMIQRDFNEEIPPYSNKLPVLFVLDVIKAIHLYTSHGRAIPIAVKLHAYALLVSFLSILAYAARIDGYI